MKMLRVESIGEAWIKSCDIILKEGVNIKDGSEGLKEVMHLIIEITKPDEKDEIIEKHGNKKMIEWMLSNFFQKLTIRELGNAKSYRSRLFDYKGKNQIEWVVKKLKRKPESKSATISLLIPNEDESYIPCVSLLDFKIRNNKLVLTTLCRSIDFGSKAFANLIALAKLQKLVAGELGVQKGEMIFHVVSAHIYEKDVERVKQILKGEG